MSSFPFTFVKCKTYEEPASEARQTRVAASSALAWKQPAFLPIDFSQGGIYRRCWNISQRTVFFNISCFDWRWGHGYFEERPAVIPWSAVFPATADVSTSAVTGCPSWMITCHPQTRPKIGENLEMQGVLGNLNKIAALLIFEVQFWPSLYSKRKTLGIWKTDYLKTFLESFFFLV